jgi:hypothetical protein
LNSDCFTSKCVKTLFSQAFDPCKKLAPWLVGPTWQTEVTGKLILKAGLQLPPMCNDDIVKHTKNNMYNDSKTGDPQHSMAFPGLVAWTAQLLFKPIHHEVAK